MTQHVEPLTGSVLLKNLLTESFLIRTFTLSSNGFPQPDNSNEEPQYVVFFFHTNIRKGKTISD